MRSSDRMAGIEVIVLQRMGIDPEARRIFEAHKRNRRHDKKLRIEKLVQRHEALKKKLGRLDAALDAIGAGVEALEVKALALRG